MVIIMILPIGRRMKGEKYPLLPLSGIPIAIIKVKVCHY
jgi:hypothetical protein